MPSKKAIKLRRAGVHTIKQIVKAMDMVAVTKLQRSKARLLATRPMFREIARVMDQLRHNADAKRHLYFREPAGNKAAYVLITSNRGLCGSYNSNVSGTALRHMEATGKEEAVIAVGNRGRDYFQRRKKRIRDCYTEIAETAFYEDAQKLSKELISLYTSGEVDEVYLAYTEFESVLTHVPRVVRLLPVGEARAAEAKLETAEPGSCPMQFDPDVDTVLEDAVPLYLTAFLYGAMQESGCSEQAARMLSMDAATKNATEIIDDLTRMYNRKRQAGITQEIAEIVGGANVNKQ